MVLDGAPTCFSSLTQRCVLPYSTHGIVEERQVETEHPPYSQDNTSELPAKRCSRRSRPAGGRGPCKGIQRDNYPSRGEDAHRTRPSAAHAWTLRLASLSQSRLTMPAEGAVSGG